MARTRSKPAAKASKDTATVAKPTKSLAPSDSNPPKLFILPKNAHKDARIVSLPDPATGAANRYFNCPTNGLYEFTRIAAPKSTPRSTLIAPVRAEQVGETQESEKSEQEDGESGNKDEESGSISKGYITRSSELFVATPMDPLFFLLPILAPATSKNQKRLFITFDDHIESLTGQLKQILAQKETRILFENRLRAICDTVEAGDESMYRLSAEKLSKILIEKAQRMVKNGLPASMEEKFIRQALQAPILSIKRDPSTLTETTEEATNSQTTTTDTQTSSISQVSATTSMTSIHVAEDACEGLPPNPQLSATPEIQHLLRLRTSLAYMLASYIPPHLRTELASPLSSLIDYTSLDTYLKHLDSLKEEARALRSLSDNISRKRGLDDDEAVEARAEKKRKKEEEEKRKANASRAAKQLKKVDTSGMKKMSSFFTKMPAKKA